MNLEFISEIPSWKLFASYGWTYFKGFMWDGVIGFEIILSFDVQSALVYTAVWHHETDEGFQGYMIFLILVDQNF